MAERRMFAKTIIDSDAFIDMPMSARLLYYDLGMRADDDGFVNSPKKIMKMIGASQDDMRILAVRKFIIPFDSGIVVIKHWKIHNYIAKDRYTETKYKEEKALLQLDENNSYTTCIQPVYKMDTQDSIGKDSIDKNSIDKDSAGEILCPAKQNNSIPYQEIINYLNERLNSHYKVTTNKTQSQIRARFNEGFTLEDFKTVIDKKINEWNGTPMQKYLRPETLFGTKFEGYLNQEDCKSFKDISNMINWEEEYDE